jgi:ABC-2 type transport system permease protein
MTCWKLERLRMTRTPRAIALAGTYVFFGLLGPVTAKYLQDIVNRFQSGVQVILANPMPRDGIANYISQISQTGLVVVIVITAGCPPSCAPAPPACGS